jgi:hypothetical protein
MQSRAASMTTLDRLGRSLMGRIRISTVICYASNCRRRTRCRPQVSTLPRPGEQGDAGAYAAIAISSTSRSISGYQPLKMAPNSPLSVRTRVCNNKCAPSLDHCICCFEGVSELWIPYQTDTPNSYRLINSPSTRSCMRSVLEKQIVRRTNRLIRVRILMCLLSIFCVLAFPTSCCSASRCRS